jgi:hypothetical protein
MTIAGEGCRRRNKSIDNLKVIPYKVYDMDNLNHAIGNSDKVYSPIKTMIAA